MDEEKRPNPDELLRQIEPEEKKEGGKLKIFFGYAAGVGKTYAMLEAAHHAQEAGVDVVAGYVEPHTRPETLALLDGLEQLPPRQIPYKGIELREFDLDAALKRHPQLILVDELAHTNAEGSRHMKRYQDVEELLRAGIDVYTTVNVQHLESLNDVVAAITGVSVAERVPDRVFDAADQVEVIDIEPEELLERLKEGKIYRTNQARQAMDHFFVKRNLAALREIALRRTADRLNRSADTASGEKAQSSEHILICLSGAPSNAKVIRTAARMAEAFHANFTALFVETSAFSSQNEAELRRLRSNLKLAEDMGAHIATVYGDDLAMQIAEYAKVSGVTKVVIGRSNHKRSLFHNRKSLVDRLTQLATNLDIYIIPDHQSTCRKPRRLWEKKVTISPIDFGKMIGILACCTLMGGVFDLVGLTESNIVALYIMGVLLTAMFTNGRICSLAASVLSVLVFNYFFTVPRFTFRFNNQSYIATFAVMFVVALLISSLATRVKRQARQAAWRAYRTEVLLETSRKLQKAEGRNAILESAALQLRKLLDRTILFYPVGADKELERPMVFTVGGEEEAVAYQTPDEVAVAQWVYSNNKRAGATTSTLPSAKCLYLAVRGEREVLAVASVAVAGQPEPDAFEKNLLLAILDECGLVLEKQRLNDEKRNMEELAQQETLRANLLRMISHDLRTPLTSISGNAGILIENGSVLDEAKRKTLYGDIYDDAMWLVNLVENLLSVTRIENGTIKVKMEPELLDEVFQEALAHLDRRASEHHIEVQLEDDLLMAKMDARLIVQVVINIVNNAIQYTPKDSEIKLSARRWGKMVKVEISDNGPGIPDDAKNKLFDMFYTADNARGDGRRGLGVGLSLCKSIINAHGGTILVEDNQPQGTKFVFTLNLAEVNAS